MAKTRTRTYKLRLSRAGFEHFLRCHHRLAGLLGELTSYGATLYVAVALLTADDPDDLVADADNGMSGRFAGDRLYFVGFSVKLAELTHMVQARYRACSSNISIARIYHMGLIAFALAKDQQILDAFQASRDDRA